MQFLKSLVNGCESRGRMSVRKGVGSNPTAVTFLGLGIDSVRELADLEKRQRGDSNPCGQSPMDFESIPLAARAQCHLHAGMMCTAYVCAHAAMAAPLVPSVAR